MYLVVTATATFAIGIATLTSPSTAGKPKNDLVAEGYKCERVGVNFIECTKNGAPTYYCDDTGNCEAKTRKIRFKGQLPPPPAGVKQ
jgi:hypothetical protein